MKNIPDNLSQLIEEFDEVISSTKNVAFLSIGIEIQKNEIEFIKKCRSLLSNSKTQFQLKFLEDEANTIFLIENTLLAIQNEIQMLVNFKEDKMDEAWENLVKAQTTFSSVIRNYPENQKPDTKYLERLSAYEKLLFPKIFFQSAGSIVKKSHCSICKKEYGECDHLKGKLYNGELCCRIITEQELEEISIVENPANKLCRILTFKRGGITIDLLTLRKVIESKKNPTDQLDNK